MLSIFTAIGIIFATIYLAGFVMTLFNSLRISPLSEAIQYAFLWILIPFAIMNTYNNPRIRRKQNR